MARSGFLIGTVRKQITEMTKCIDLNQPATGRPLLIGYGNATGYAGSQIEWLIQTDSRSGFPRHEIRGHALFFIFFAVVIERRRRRMTFCAGLTRLLRDCRARHRLPRGQHHHRNGRGQNCTHRHYISHYRSPDYCADSSGIPQMTPWIDADRNRPKWWREATTRCMRRCAAARIHSTHASHANQHGARGRFPNRNADRDANVAMKKLCIAGAAYRVENANLFFTSSRPMHGKNVLRRTAGTDNPSHLVAQAIEMMERIATGQAVAWGLLNRSSRTSRQVP